jgi:3-(3-hydroxy-phenyl)propionate hydroxylase
VYRFHSRIVNRMRVGRVLIAGDCAHLVSPFGARGLNSGVPDAENAAWKLAYVLHGWADAELLESYHHERHAAARENLEVTTATMDFLVPQNEEQRRGRLEILRRAAADSRYRERVDSGRLAEPFWYVDSPLTTPDPARPFAGRPELGCAPPAGPGTVVPDVPISANTLPQKRLREVARNGLLILAGPEADPAVVEPAAADAATGPVRVLRIDEVDPGGALAGALATGPGEVWVIRPDAYIAAVLDRPDTGRLVAALRRALGGDMVSQASQEVGGHGTLPAGR